MNGLTTTRQWLSTIYLCICMKQQSSISWKFNGGHPVYRATAAEGRCKLLKSKQRKQTMNYSGNYFYHPLPFYRKHFFHHCHHAKTATIFIAGNNRMWWGFGASKTACGGTTVPQAEYSCAVTFFGLCPEHCGLSGRTLSFSFCCSCARSPSCSAFTWWPTATCYTTTASGQLLADRSAHELICTVLHVASCSQHYR